MKRAGWVIAAVAAVVLGLVAWAAWPRAAEAAYVTTPASRGEVTQTISLVGPVQRDGQAEISYRSDGLVTAVHVRVGDEVTAGQQIVSIDPAPLRLAVLRARAQVAQAEAQLDADLAAQRSGGTSVPAGLGGALGGAGMPALPTGGLPTGGSSGALPTGGLPTGGLPTGGLPGMPGMPGMPGAG
ncbi:MAG TPA: biotin/lipoyl-binding protein, partial [Propionibacterium sp.]|nr:biotin/lipoyl-binding protein [Propionibacterium sp.]